MKKKIFFFKGAQIQKIISPISRFYLWGIGNFYYGPDTAGMLILAPAWPMSPNCAP